MCGRFQLNAEQAVLEAEYKAHFEDVPNFPMYNVAPTTTMPVILNEDPSLIQMVRWGLTPSWSKKDLINVRAETIAEKKTFKKSFEERRCLVPSTGFYEWKKTEGGKKIPYYIGLKDEEIFSFAGIWSTYKNEDGENVREFAIITTTPNELTAKIHDRMPVILKKEDEATWLNEEDLNIVGSLMKSYPASDMRTHQISTKINNPKYNDAALINPL